MKKHLVIIGVIVILVCVGLSGCEESKTSDFTNETQISGYTNKVQLLNYTVETYGWDFGQQYTKIGYGFIHDVYDNGEYIIKGTLKNKAAETLSTIKIIVNFYDKNTIFLTKAEDTIHNLPVSQTADFQIKYENDQDYYYDIEHIEFAFQVS